ncbi:MAG: hypothetical protein ACRDIY_03705, partial [Chloroflexota bacterium]
MSSLSSGDSVSRRGLLKVVGSLVATGALAPILAACQSQATPAAPTTASQAPAQPAATTAPAAQTAP